MHVLYGNRLQVQLLNLKLTTVNSHSTDWLKHNAMLITQ